eukprot:8641387-Alexandrium_andersonii.AAC.1
MSASLVGSEMCIRDSSLPCKSILSCSAAPVGRRPWEIPEAPLPRGVCPCLLYTSDAADDM